MKDNCNIPQFKWEPFKYRVIHCYTSEVRKVERFATCNARNEKKYYQNEMLFEDREISAVGASLLQENQYTCLLYPNFEAVATSAKYYASDYGQHGKGVAIAFHIIQLPNEHFEFCFYIAIKKKLVCEFQYCSEIGRYEQNFGTDPYKNEPYKQELSLEQYLKKMPDTIILDESGGKTLHKKDLLPIFEMIEQNKNDWETILEKLEELLYGRCLPLEQPSFAMKTPSRCPVGYELVDMYDSIKLGVRSEIYYSIGDKEKLPKYKR